MSKCSVYKSTTCQSSANCAAIQGITAKSTLGGCLNQAQPDNTFSTICQSSVQCSTETGLPPWWVRISQAFWALSLHASFYKPVPALTSHHECCLWLQITHLVFPLHSPMGKGGLTFWGLLGQTTKAALQQQLVWMLQKMLLDSLILRLHLETWRRT